MSKNNRSRKLVIAFALTFAFFFLFCESEYGQKPAMYTRGNWQTSLEPGKWVDGKPYVYTASGSIRIGVRDKYGALGNYSASFLITSPDNRTYKHIVNVKGDDWGYAALPDNFNTAGLQPGIYSAKIYVKNQLVVSFKIKYTP